MGMGIRRSCMTSLVRRASRDRPLEWYPASAMHGRHHAQRGAFRHHHSRETGASHISPSFRPIENVTLSVTSTVVKRLPGSWWWLSRTGFRGCGSHVGPSEAVVMSCVVFVSPP